jgi:hypothetical protein
MQAETDVENLDLRIDRASSAHQKTVFQAHSSTVIAAQPTDRFLGSVMQAFS